MWESILGYHGRGGYGGYDDWGVDRSGWSDKSDAALRREREADGLFDAFLERCSAEDANDKSLFPITEKVVRANVHLTGACYTSFRKRVIAKGCKVKRREATPVERRESGDSRKGKMYVIYITCPVHPGKAKEAKEKAARAAAEKKKKAREAAERKAEKERKERQERERLAALHRAKVRERYEAIVGARECDAEEEGNKKRKQPPAEKCTATMDEFVEVNVTSEALLDHARAVHEKRTSGIRASVRKEESELMAELRKRHAKEESDLRSTMTKKESELIGDANAEYDVTTTKIKGACGQEKAMVEAVAETGYYNGE